MAAPFLPWTGGYGRALTGWDLTSHFGLVWDLAGEGSSETVWIDSGLALTTGGVTFAVGATILFIAAMHLRPRSHPASSTVSMWLASVPALVIGLNPWFALDGSPPDDARIGALVGVVAGAAVPIILVADVIGRAVKRRAFGGEPSAA